MDKIKLNFINKSFDTNNSSVVIFQKNGNEDSDALQVAWIVIQNCGRLDNHPFNYPMNVTVNAEDSYGNYSQQLFAKEGQCFEMIKDTSGNVLQLAKNPATNPSEIAIANNLSIGAINANCYRDGKLIATKRGLSPGQKAVFRFQPTIYIGVVSQIEEGDVMNSAIISQINTEISLFGISSADIVMTGGGSGPNATPFQFNLENINTF